MFHYIKLVIFWVFVISLLSGIILPNLTIEEVFLNTIWPLFYDVTIWFLEDIAFPILSYFHPAFNYPDGVETVKFIDGRDTLFYNLLGIGLFGVFGSFFAGIVVTYWALIIGLFVDILSTPFTKKDESLTFFEYIQLMIDNVIETSKGVHEYFIVKATTDMDLKDQIKAQYIADVNAKAIRNELKKSSLKGNISLGD